MGTSDPPGDAQHFPFDSLASSLENVTKPFDRPGDRSFIDHVCHEATGREVGLHARRDRNEFKTGRANLCKKKKLENSRKIMFFAARNKLNPKELRLIDKVMFTNTSEN